MGLANVPAIDQAVLDLFVSRRPVWLSEIVAWFSEISRPAYVLAIVLLVSAVMAIRGKQQAIIVPIVLGVTNGVVHILKPLIRRERPDREYQLVYEFSASMPSGHSAAAIALAVIVSLMGVRVMTVVLVWVWALLVASSRLYLGVHWLTDVVVGSLLGAFIAAVVWWLYRRATAPKVNLR